MADYELLAESGVILVEDAVNNKVYAKIDHSVIARPNILINSDGAINQEGVSGTVTLAADEYGHDGLKGGASGATYTFAATTGITTFTITAGSLIQTVETTKAGAHTLSWIGTAEGSLDGGTAAMSPVTETLTGGTTVDCEWEIGTLSMIKLEEGSGATKWTKPDPEIEKARCQRLYYKHNPAAYGGFGFGAVNTTTAAYVHVFHPVEMRIPPSIAYSGTLQLQNGSSYAVSALAIPGGTGSTLVSRVQCTSAGLTPNEGIELNANNDADAYIAFNARL